MITLKSPKGETLTAEDFLSALSLLEDMAKDLSKHRNSVGKKEFNNALLLLKEHASAIVRRNQD